jgi:two-component sensor histidine kinase
VQTNASTWFPVSDETPANARAWIEEQFDGSSRGLSETCSLVSELVTDALRRHPERITIDLQRSDGVVRVEVSDNESGLVEKVDDTTERGIRRDLVESLASRWGAETDRDRTTVWFEIATEASGDGAPS